MLLPRKQSGGAVLFASVMFLGLGALYLLFAGSLGTDECVAVGGTAALGSAWWWLLHRRTDRPLRVAGAPWLRLVFHPLLAVCSDSACVGGVLMCAVAGRRPSGRLQWQALRHGGDAPEAAGRRGAVTLALSLAPNGIVLDWPGEADAALLHRLAPAPAQRDREWPA